MFVCASKKPMDYLLVLLIGIAIGWLSASIWSIIWNRWKSSLNQRQSYEKAIKELAERGKKVKEERRRSFGSTVRAVIEMLLFLAVVLLVLIVLFNLLVLS
jgi:H+/gluconate symporter-like permease